jgi:hydroxymethylpyrimidine pyrophosphatase-like HAD family hydrolase
MVFFTDLDRTLIYSKRFINIQSDKVVLAERDGDKEIAYMTDCGLEMLEDLSRKITIVPVTTRNYAEFKRIHILQNLYLKYYIINNGAEIYIDDKLDEKYSSLIKNEMEHLSYGFDTALQKFLHVFDKKSVKLYRLSDNYLWVVVINNEIFDYDSLADLKSSMLKEGWQIERTGKKVYIVPNCISKWKAVKYLNDNYLHQPIISAGDSYIDMEMIINSDMSIIPHGCELEEQMPLSRSTKSSGIKAGEEILLYIKKLWEAD